MTVRYMDMTAADLRAEYWSARAAVAGWDGMTAIPQNRAARGRIAGGVFAALDRLDLIVNVARKRKIALITGREEPRT